MTYRFKFKDIIVGSLLILTCIFGCSQEKCALCQVLNRPEIYIQPVCGDEDFINSHIRWQEHKYAPDHVKCTID